MAFNSQCWGSWKEIFLLQSERVAISPVLLPSAPGAAFLYLSRALLSTHTGHLKQGNSWAHKLSLPIVEFALPRWLERQLRNEWQEQWLHSETQQIYDHGGLTIESYDGQLVLITAVQNILSTSYLWSSEYSNYNHPLADVAKTETVLHKSVVFL